MGSPAGAGGGEIRIFNVSDETPSDFVSYFPSPFFLAGNLSMVRVSFEMPGFLKVVIYDISGSEEWESLSVWWIYLMWGCGPSKICFFDVV